LNIIIFYRSWKSNTSINYYVHLALLDSWSQFSTSHAIFNHHAYTKRMDRIISCKSSSFPIHDVASWSTLPTPHAIKPNMYNSCYEINLTKTGFGNGGHCFAIVTNLSYSYCPLVQVRLTTFWSFHLSTSMTFPKMWTFILTWS